MKTTPIIPDTAHLWPTPTKSQADAWLKERSRMSFDHHYRTRRRDLRNTLIFVGLIILLVILLLH